MGDTPTQIITDWYNEYGPDIDNYGMHDDYATELMISLAPMFAAGPWRTDVENAEPAQHVIAIWSDGFWCKARLAPSGHGWQDARGRYMNTPIAFAAINQPEETK